jgi:hypothetical protein
VQDSFRVRGRAAVNVTLTPPELLALFRSEISTQAYGEMIRYGRVYAEFDARRNGGHGVALVQALLNPLDSAQLSGVWPAAAHSSEGLPPCGPGFAAMCGKPPIPPERVPQLRYAD